MPRANDLMRAAVVVIVTIPALLAGCAQRDGLPASGSRVAFDSSAVASHDLPEVVITAQRPRSKAIVLSAGDAQPVR